MDGKRLIEKIKLRNILSLKPLKPKVERAKPNSSQVLFLERRRGLARRLMTQTREIG